MAVLKILRAGNPLLRHRAAPVKDVGTPEIITLVRDMTETLQKTGGVGLAANQVGHSLQMFIYRVPTERSPGEEEIPTTVLINPEVTLLDTDMDLAFEGCLSLPSLTGAVPRSKRIGLRAQLINGTEIEREVEGFHARVIQHEYDHLSGKLYIDRMVDFSSFGFVDELVEAARQGRS